MFLGTNNDGQAETTDHGGSGVEGRIADAILVVVTVRIGGLVGSRR